MKIPPIIWCLLLIFPACKNDVRSTSDLQAGPWRFMFDLNGHTAPIAAEVQRRDEAIKFVIMNAEERIEMEEVRIENDSIFIRLPLYDTELIGLVGDGGKSITGHWLNLNRGPGYKVSFIAEALDANDRNDLEDARIAEGRWAVRFDPDGAEPSSAIGLFKSHENGRLTGSFATETGDHRFLAGFVRNDSLKLSSFDGSHVYLYEARINGDTMHGRFNSGIHHEEDWVAVRNADFDLRDPTTITVPTEAKFQFEFPDLNGQLVSSEDQRFKHKVMVVQVMGSWCSNCADEAAELNELYRTYKNEGLEIVALAFEKQEDPVRSLNVLKRFRDGLKIQYPILFAGHARTASEKLPFIDRLRSYPTSIFIDHTGKVRSIHTGNYGPGTGEFHQRYRKKITALVEQLVQERSSAR